MGAGYHSCTYRFAVQPRNALPCCAEGRANGLTQRAIPHTHVVAYGHEHAYMVCEGYAQRPGMCSKPLHTVELDLDCVGEEHEYVIQAVRARCEHGSKQVRQRGRLLDAAGGVGHRMHAPSHHREPQRRRRRALCLWFGYMGAQQSW